MSKKLTVTKALKDLRQDAKNHLEHHVIYLNERIDVIEKEIKNLRKYKKICLKQLH